MLESAQARSITGYFTQSTLINVSCETMLGGDSIADIKNPW